MDTHALTADELRQQCTLGDEARGFASLMRTVGFVGLAGAAVLAYLAKDDYASFQFAYLVAYMFFLTIHLGALGFVAINHLVGTKWNVTVRRLAEILCGGFPLMAVLVLPIVVPMLMGNYQLYEWADPVKQQTDHLIHLKAAYLNPTFFVIRLAVFFLIWTAMARFFVKNSRAQDLNGDPALTVRMRKLAAPIVIVYALTLTFAAFDLEMSLEPHWFSTIFGVYVFAGSKLSFFATLILACLFMQERGRLKDVVTKEHYHDLGKWLFAFTFFWGYIAFSQYMLIWYADIPEETFWFDMRSNGPWHAVCLLLLFGHFVLPFGGLLSRHVKRNKAILGFWAAFVLLMHYADHYWIVKPTLDEQSLGFGMLDVASFLGIGGLVAGGFLARARGGLIAAIRDPFWNESLRFKNL
jgi:hypothetical protein